MKKSLTLVSIGILSAAVLSGCETTMGPMGPGRAPSFTQAKEDFTNHNYAKAFVEVQGPAKAGIPDAQYALGYMYFYGKGVAENHKAAEYWFQKAAAQGQGDAQRALDLINKQKAKG
jgi:TPR repeat protein